MDEVEKLHEVFERRWPSIVKRSHEYGISPPNKDALWQKILNIYHAGFCCEYCGERMDIEFNPDNPHSWTIDHGRPLYLGGTNEIGNLLITCNACNTFKMTASAEKFLELKRACDLYRPNFFKELRDEAWKGMRARRYPPRKETKHEAI